MGLVVCHHRPVRLEVQLPINLKAFELARLKVPKLDSLKVYGLVSPSTHAHLP